MTRLSDSRLAFGPTRDRHVVTAVVAAALPPVVLHDVLPIGFTVGILMFAVAYGVQSLRIGIVCSDGELFIRNLFRSYRIPLSNVAHAAFDRRVKPGMPRRLVISLRTGGAIPATGVSRWTSLFGASASGPYSRHDKRVAAVLGDAFEPD